MYQIGNHVVYGIQGVCKVAGTETRKGKEKVTEYLILESVEKADLRYYNKKWVAMLPTLLFC